MEVSDGNVSRARVEELTFAPDGGVSICGGFNPFGLSSVLPACADYIAVDAGIDADVQQWIAEATARGSPVACPRANCAWRSACNIAVTSTDTMRMTPCGRSCRTAVRTSLALRLPTTSMPTTTTPTFTSRPRFRCWLTGRASVARIRPRIPLFRLRVGRRCRHVEG